MPRRLTITVSLVLAIWSCLVSTDGRGQNMNKADDEQTVELSLLTTGKKVIPLVCEYPSLLITDIKLPDLVVSNHLTVPVTPVEMQVIGTASGKKIAALFVGQDRLVSLISQANPQFRRVLATSDTRDRLAYELGEVSVDAVALSESAAIGPRQCAVILLSRILHFHVAGVERIDGLEVVVSVERGKGIQTVVLNLPLHFHETKVDYLFPVRGSVTIADMPMNYHHHRRAHSQEFALDITAEAPSASGKLMSSRKENSSELSDYYIYRREVLAAADGTVVEVANSFPEEESVSPAGWTQAASAAAIKRLARRIGYQSAAIGNYMTIEHAPDEFSFYAHLSQDSIRVKAGDKVKAGQVIALVGSTGNSSEPHLHFQVMDSREFPTANGLPVKFVDVPPAKMNQYLVAANTIATSDYLHLFLPEISQTVGKGKEVEPSGGERR